MEHIAFAVGAAGLVATVASLWLAIVYNRRTSQALTQIEGEARAIRAVEADLSRSVGSIEQSVDRFEQLYVMMRDALEASTPRALVLSLLRASGQIVYGELLEVAATHRYTRDEMETAVRLLRGAGRIIFADPLSPSTVVSSMP